MALPLSKIPKEDKDRENRAKIMNSIYDRQGRKSLDGLLKKNPLTNHEFGANAAREALAASANRSPISANPTKKQTVGEEPPLGLAGSPDVNSSPGISPDSIDPAATPENDDGLVDDIDQGSDDQDFGDSTDNNPVAEPESAEEPDNSPAKDLLERYQKAEKDKAASSTDAAKNRYQEQGGEAIQARRPGPESKNIVNNVAEKQADRTSKKAARRYAAGEGAGALGRVAGSAGKLANRLASAGKLASAVASNGLRALGMLYMNPATAPWAWGISAAVILIVLIIGVSTGFFGASATSPNSAGKSMSEPVAIFDSALTDILKISNVNDLQKKMVENKQVLLDALKKAEDQLATTGLTEAKVTDARKKIEELKQILEQIQAENTAANTKLAESFKTKVRELIEICGPTLNPIKGTALPMKEADITRYGDDDKPHGSIYINPANAPLHNSFFGGAEKGGSNNDSKSSLAKCTADAIDLWAPVGTTVYAPFPGEYTYYPKGDSRYPDAMILKGQVDGHPMEAVLAHLSPSSGNSGKVTGGQVIGKLHEMGSSGPHLHFELRVDNLDVSRKTSSQTHKDLWNMMKKILSGGA